MSPSISDILRHAGALACLDCGKCTAVCPVARHVEFSPRRSVTLLAAGEGEGGGVWECLTCDRCNVECPSDVQVARLVGQVRAARAAAGDLEVPCAHGGALHAMMRLAADAQGAPRRLDWVDGNLKIAEKGDVCYFVGCQPHFEVLFEDLDVAPLSAARAAVRLLNAVGVQPVLLPDERCCGHDLLWSGDVERFRTLARLNVEAIARAGAKTVVFSCAEGYRTFLHEVPEHLGPLPFTPVHITEFLAGRVGALALAPRPFTVTYHDPCRLGRMGNVFKSPRLLLDAVPDLTVVEMPRSRDRSACCGTSLWAGCGTVSRALQAERLAEAAATGADVLVTACPKCRIHFACARAGDAAGEIPAIEVADIVELLAGALAPAP